MKHKHYVWHGLAVVIAGFEEPGAFVIDEKVGVSGTIVGTGYGVKS